MKQNSASGSLSTAILCSCTIIAKHLIIGPQFMISQDGNAAWIEITSKCALAAIVLAAFIWLYKPLFPKSPIELFYDSVGRGVGNVLSYIYAFGFILLNAGLLRILVDALGPVMALNAPHEFFSLFIIIPVLAASFCGLRAAGNLCTIVFPFVIFTLFVVSLILPHYRLDNIFPILGNGKDILLSGIFTKRFGFTELFVLIFLAPKLGNYKNLKRASIITIIIVSIFTVFFTLSYCLTIPYPASKSFFLPLYQITRMIKAGTFLQRLEPLSVFIWTSCIMCSLSTLSSISASLLSKGNSTRKNALAPIVVITTFFLAMLPKNELSASYIYKKMLDFSYILYPVIPFVLVIIARIRRKASQ